MKGLTQAVHAGSFWVEYFPFLKHVPGTFVVVSIHIYKYKLEWFPGASFKRKAKFWAQSAIALRDLPFNEVQELIVSPPNVCPSAAADFTLARIMEQQLHVSLLRTSRSQTH